jgi:ABC-type nitrate/sulfonate/bicarbonate transport system permease component
VQTANSVQAVAIVLFAVVASMLVRKGRTDPNISTLQPRQRIRPITLEWLDPLLAVIVVGPLLGHEINLSAWHVVAALVGATIGVPIGILCGFNQWTQHLPVE